MPNHESNYVTVTGTPENIRLFIEMAFVEPGEAWPGAPDSKNEKDFPEICFELIVPQPANIERDGCPGGAVNGVHPETGEVCWYAWNIENWGTKWGPYGHSLFQLRWLDNGRDVYGRLDIVFETAWSQPTPIFLAIEQRFGVTVHAVTQDEGGYPDVEYGDPYGEEVIRKVITHEFDTWHSEVPEPTVAG